MRERRLRTPLLRSQQAANALSVLRRPLQQQVKVVRKEAQPEREGKHPFTGEMTVFKAKPAKNLVKVTALKKLKDAVQLSGTGVPES